MAKREVSRPGIRNITWFTLAMIVGYALIVIIAITVVSFLAIRKTDTVLKNKVISMASSLNVQMKLNMNSYISRMETIGTLAFGVEEAYTFDATDPDNDEFEAINAEKVISDKLYSLCIMENFVDYAIVYSNNRTVGKLSNGTASLFGNTIYDQLHSMITRQRTNDGWAAGYNDDFRRIYYVKRIHDNALLVISFYSVELEAVFDNPENLRGMEVRLTNEDQMIIYSSEADEVGKPLPEEISRRIKNESSATVMDNEYLVSVNSCGDNWYVICSVPTDIILNEKNEMKYYIAAVAFIAALLAVLLGTELSIRITKPVKKIVFSLDTKASIDQLTGILNKKSFEESAASFISSSLMLEKHAVIILDLDNFKGVNDTLGHAYGDIVLTKTGSILRAAFSTEDVLGRVGGDEFCVLVNNCPENISFEKHIEDRCEALSREFRNNYTGDNGDYKISASIGVAVFPDHGSSFEELYSAADKALYRSKQLGKDTYTIYDKSMKEEDK